MKININDDVKVRLTNDGRSYLLGYGEAFYSDYPATFAKLMLRDSDGYVTMQLWKLMEIFGKYMWHGAKQMFVNNEILISD